MLGLRNLHSFWKCDQLMELEIQSVELKNGVSLYFLSGKTVLLCLSQISILEVIYKCIALWFNPSRHLSTIQPLAHSPLPPQWVEGENRKGKVKKLMG